jgi:hypothetical protein
MKKIFMAAMLAILTVAGLAAITNYTNPKLAHYTAADTGDDRYVLVDKGTADSVFLRQFDLDWKADGAAAWTVNLGVVVTDSSTTGNAEILYSFPIQVAGADSGHETITFSSGYDVVLSGGTVLNLTSGVLDASSDWVNDSVTMECAGGDTCVPDQGDIVLIVDEVSGSATFTIGSSLLYNTFE